MRSGSTIKQHVSITSDAYESLENYDETRAVLPDISTRWHDGMVYKLKCNGKYGNQIKLLWSYLKDHTSEGCPEGATGLLLKTN